MKQSVLFINGLIIIMTLFIKSLLTSLCQREEIPLFGKEGRGEIFNQCKFYFETVYNNIGNMYFMVNFYV